jgi:CheY-like chemotaxis protein
MGGDVSAQSVEGEGSTFTLRLPLHRVRPAPPLKIAPEPAYRPPALALRVLAAEDNPTNQLVLKTLLNTAGIEPTVVANGVEAVAAWAGEAWDLILMDVHMPVMDGLDAVKAIRQQEARSGAARTRIVALTADVMDHQVREYLAAGMDECLAKPIAIAKLFEILTQAQPAPDARSDAA